MSRPSKTTLEFVQLDTVDKTTLKRLHRKFGVEGRLFWYELLRLLGRSNNYFIDLSDNWTLEDVLEEELFVDKLTGIAIINALVSWGAVDKELWENHKIIWCQNLIDRHIHLFNKRNKIPRKPTSSGVSVSEIEVSGAETLVSEARSTHSIVEYSIEKDNYVIQKEIDDDLSVGKRKSSAESDLIKAEKKQREIQEKAAQYSKQLEDPKEQLWRDTFYMQQGLRPRSLGKLLGEFNKHLVLHPPDKPKYEYSEYKRHFSHWINKQNQIKKLNKYKL